MIILLSPSKTMDSETPLPLNVGTDAPFTNDAATLVDSLRSLSLGDLQNLLDVSDKLAQLNYDRYQVWSKKHGPSNSRPAIYMFKGDAYVGLDGYTLSQDDLDYAQDRLVILSGLYGVLRPKDLMQPYRVEMGGAFIPPGSKGMLDFWKPRVTAYLKKTLADDTNPWIMNLASTEYSNAVDFKTIGVPVVTPKFLENKNGSYKMVSSFAKKARGMMTRWLITQRLEDRQRLAGFTDGNYAFDKDTSVSGEPVFKR